MPFAPYLKGGRKPTTAIARKLIKAHLGGGVPVDATSICTITTAVTPYVNSDTFEGIRPMDSRSTGGPQLGWRDVISLSERSNKMNDNEVYYFFFWHDGPQCVGNIHL